MPTAQDRPPRLRFELTAQPDGILSAQTGRDEFMNVILVHISAAGDMKNEVPDIAEQTAYDEHVKRVDVERKVPKYIEDAITKKVTETTETITFQEDRTFYVPKVISPWINKLKDRLKHGYISQAYFDYCNDAFKAFKQNQSIPTSGYPLANWRGIDPAMRDRLIGMGLNTVELVSEMNEEAMQYAGMGARAVKDKAKAFLLANSAPEKATVKITQLESQNAAMSEQLSAMQAKLQELLDHKSKAETETDLASQYKDLTGKDPDKRWGEKKLRELIEAEKQAA
jgi:hypothetical protein